MTKKIEYSCNCCEAVISNNKVVGVRKQDDKLTSMHPLKCDVHFCESCLASLVEIVEYAKGSQERAIAP